MLAPDVDSSESSMQSGINAAQQVTQNSQAVITLVPAYYSALSGYASIQQMLEGVVNDAQTWPNTLCASYTQDVPGLFISYNTTFQQNAANLEMQVETLTSDPNNAAAKSSLVSGLQTLLDQLQQLEPPMDDLQTQLTAYETTLQNDYDSIDAALTQLSNTVPGAGTVIESVSATLNVTFYSSDMLSPCDAIVMLNSDVEVQLKAALNTQPEVVPVVLARTLLSTLETQNSNATTAMSTILDEWSTLIGKYQAVITDLQNAQGAPSPILEELDIETAQVAWSQLASFAQTLAPNT